MKHQKKQESILARLRARIEIEPLSKDFGGGYEASIPALGKYTYVGWGKTPEEALGHLAAVAEDLMEQTKKRGEK